MHTPAPSWSPTQIISDSNNLAASKQRIQKQLASVFQLLEHNAAYLDSSERSWIEDIIGEAALVTGYPHSSGISLSPQPVTTNLMVGTLHDRSNVQNTRLRSRSPARVVDEDDINALLATSKHLNSANGLLSCCYDRWSWLQLSRADRDKSRINADDLQELLGRRRQRQRLSNHARSQFPDNTRLPRRNNTISSASSQVATTSNDGSENSLSLMVDDTIERWRQNAEDALNETTARLRAGNIGPYQSATQRHSQELSTCRPCITERGSPLFVSEGDAAAEHTCITRSLTQRLSMPSSRPSTRYRHSAHTGATGAACESFSQETSSLPQLSEENRAVRPAFRPTLHNSFDKEAINDVPPNLLPKSASTLR